MQLRHVHLLYDTQHRYICSFVHEAKLRLQSLGYLMHIWSVCYDRTVDSIHCHYPLPMAESLAPWGDAGREKTYHRAVSFLRKLSYDRDCLEGLRRVQKYLGYRLIRRRRYGLQASLCRLNRSADLQRFPAPIHARDEHADLQVRGIVEARGTHEKCLRRKRHCYRRIVQDVRESRVWLRG